MRCSIAFLESIELKAPRNDISELRFALSCAFALGQVSIVRSHVRGSDEEDEVRFQLFSNL
jgi:hypothetical protein